MKEIFAYKIAKSETSDGISYIVQDLISENWQPVGDVKVTTQIDEDRGTIFYFYQTMVKFEQ